jgi:hypothetical protein
VVNIMIQHSRPESRGNLYISTGIDASSPKYRLHLLRNEAFLNFAKEHLSPRQFSIGGCEMIDLEKLYRQEQRRWLREEAPDAPSATY